MKKLIMGILGLMLLLPIGVDASGPKLEWEIINSITEGDNSIDASVTVGEVDVPVYSVQISWQNFRFEWKYDKKLNSYGWKAAEICQPLNITTSESFDEFSADRIIYTDNACMTETTSYDESITEYYYRLDDFSLTDDNGAYILITDQTENGSITPSLTWNATEDYGYVEGKFSYFLRRENVCKPATKEDIETFSFVYSDNECKTEWIDADTIEYEEGKYFVVTEVRDYTLLTTPTVPSAARVENDNSGIRTYELVLQLENKVQPQKTPTTGEKIGTVTISISANE